MKSLSIVNLNCFGIPVFVHKKERFYLLAEELNKIQPDIIALQEVFVWNNRNVLIDKLRSEYNVYPQTYTPFGDGGLLTFVRKNIEVNEFTFTRFKNSGGMTLISIPEAIAGKGYQILNISIGDSNLDLVNTQLLCQYNQSDYLVKSYTNQIVQLTESVKNLASKNLILTGDLNSEPETEFIKSIQTRFDLQDGLAPNNYTVDTENLNRGSVMNFLATKQYYRVDYTLVSNTLKIIDQKVIFKEVFKLGNRKYNLSDHFGISTTIALI